MRVAIVVQRCHESIVGGSEALAWQYATLLGRDHDVDVLTTTALDYRTWANALPSGLQRRDGVTVRRFAVTIGRSAYWHELHRRWLRHRLLVRGWPIDAAAVGCTPFSPALEEEFLRQQGPYSEALLDYLERRQADYAAVLFVTYVYPTTYFGAARVDPGRCLLVPTLHDEPTAYFKVFRNLARRAGAVLWLTEQERQVGRALWGDLPGSVVGMAVQTEPAAPAVLGFPYLLYAGRIDPGKRCDELLAWFRRWKDHAPSPVRLVLIGEDHVGVPAWPDVVYRGHVAEAEKRALMAGAAVFVMPSAWESFSAATLEAMAQGTPVLVNGACAVLLDHVRHSGGGQAYTDQDSFRTALDDMLASPAQRAAWGARGRRYVLDHYQAGQVRDRLLAALVPRTGPRAAVA
jgi:glycosyltransferase involved in cell wall biosynthesis